MSFLSQLSGPISSIVTQIAGLETTCTYGTRDSVSVSFTGLACIDCRNAEADDYNEADLNGQITKKTIAIPRQLDSTGKQFPGTNNPQINEVITFLGIVWNVDNVKSDVLVPPALWTFECSAYIAETTGGKRRGG